MDEYLNYSDVFLIQKALVLPEQTKLNEYVIELEEDKQLFYRLIYSLELVKLKILKTDIETHLKTWFI